MLKNWIKAIRVRTLPLSISGILVANSISLYNINYSFIYFIWAIITAILFQVISNLANDYGDFVKGTDNDNRIGPKRTMQSGIINSKQMKTAILLVSVLALISGILLIYYSTTKLSDSTKLLFYILCLLSIISAITYTIGKKAFGYLGLGDIFVLIFFGFVSVNCTYIILNQNLDMSVNLLSLSFGLFSVAVLNLNNMRDMENDIMNNKNTIASKIGFKNSKLYHFIIINIAIISILIFIFIQENKSVYFNLLIIPLIIYIRHLIFVNNCDKNKDLDSQLKVVSLNTFLTAILFNIIYFIST